MDRSTMLKFLKDYPDMTDMVYRLRNEIELIDRSIENVKMLGADTDLIRKYESRRENLLGRIKAIYGQQQKITDLINSLDLDERRVIEARYIKKLKWDYVPTRVYASRATCFRIHDKALDKLVEKYAAIA